MIVAYLAFLMGGLTVGMGIHRVFRLRRLLKNGEHVSATVTGVGNSTEGRFYKLSFENKGGVHSVQYKLPRRGEIRRKIGDTVDFYYDPADPDQNHIAGEKSELSNATYYFVLGVVIFCLGIASYFENAL